MSFSVIFPENRAVWDNVEKHRMVKPADQDSPPFETAAIKPSNVFSWYKLSCV
jgi:hypothetical protein